MNSDDPDMSFMRVIRGFGYAFSGVYTLFRTQRSARIHGIATLILVGLGLWLRLPLQSWCWLTVAVAMVWTAEAFNTAIEFLSDVVSPGFHPGIKKVKDISSAAVFMSVIGALTIGALVLVPPLLKRLTGG